jgi:hypothetical protein
VEPGLYRTEISNSSPRIKPPDGAYAPLRIDWISPSRGSWRNMPASYGRSRRLSPLRGCTPAAVPVSGWPIRTRCPFHARQDSESSATQNYCRIFGIERGKALTRRFTAESPLSPPPNHNASGAWGRYRGRSVTSIRSVANQKNPAKKSLRWITPSFLGWRSLSRRLQYLLFVSCSL